MTEFVLGQEHEFQDGKGRAFNAGGRTVAVFRSQGKFYAISNKCIHKGASMCEGDITPDGKYVRCPWHNWSFDLSTGVNPLNGEERQRTYQVEVKDGAVVLVI
jgi:nitrite reductase/ring-hydroxylating ferredoxin subunit